MRFYNPATGRFLTLDPDGTKGGFNPYEYCDDDPINESDRTGLAPTTQPASQPSIWDESSGNNIDFHWSSPGPTHILPLPIGLPDPFPPQSSTNQSGFDLSSIPAYQAPATQPSYVIQPSTAVDFNVPKEPVQNFQADDLTEKEETPPEGYHWVTNSDVETLKDLLSSTKSPFIKTNLPTQNADSYFHQGYAIMETTIKLNLSPHQVGTQFERIIDGQSLGQYVTTDTFTHTEYDVWNETTYTIQQYKYDQQSLSWNWVMIGSISVQKPTYEIERDSYNISSKSEYRAQPDSGNVGLPPNWNTRAKK